MDRVGTAHPPTNALRARGILGPHGRFPIANMPEHRRILDYLRPRTPDEGEIRVSRLAIIGFVVSALSCPMFLRPPFEFALRAASPVLGIPQAPMQQRTLVLIMIVPTLISLVLNIVAGERIRRHPNQRRGMTLALLGVTLCVFWLLGGTCLFFGIWFWEGFTRD